MNSQDIVDRLSNIDQLCFDILKEIKRADFSCEEGREDLLGEVRRMTDAIQDKTSMIRTELN